MYIPWDIRLSLDLFLGGLGIGAFLIVVLLNKYDRERYHKIINLGAIAAPVAIVLGLLFLIWELGRPERFYYTIIGFNPTSVISWGSLIQGALMPVLIIYAFLLIKDLDANIFFKLIEIVGVILALATGIYHGMVLSNTGVPLWIGGMMPVMFLSSSFLGGLAVILIIKSLSVAANMPAKIKSKIAAVGNEVSLFNFNKMLFSLLLIQLLLTIVWQISIYASGAGAAESMRVMMDSYGSLWWSLVIIVGLLIPLLGSLYQTLISKSKELSSGMALVLSIAIIIGSFAFKHIIITAGQVGQLSTPFF